MRSIQTVSLVGLGAIGAIFGKKLQNYLGDKFQVIVNKERMERYQKTGITINGEKQKFHYITPDTEVEPADLVIIATKNAELKQAIVDARNHIGKDTIILSLLNGISSEEEIYDATENEHILYSMTYQNDPIRHKQEINYQHMGLICFGEKNGSLSEDVLAVKDLFDRAEVPYEIPKDVWHVIWAKFMFNVAVNQISAVLKAPYSNFQKIPELKEWMEFAMYEVVALSKEVGVNLTDKDVHQYRPILQNLSPNGKTSMLQDIEANRKTEVEFFAGKVCELGKKYSVPTPINDQLYKMIHIMEEMAKLNN
ncbi:ketopantoate reductase family protein [Oceanobacillus sp. Castelsardo]|uniref:ketopantoate reductase family protein n=1 Tax=Oceanobacillus sp. Castelsardo TaxID=1851204 RepID=UPI00083941F8|nr:2-dehydropantoate 2-reductase [Oceanobacillus sp. Castelsardo]